MGYLFGYYGKNVRKAVEFTESLDIKALYTLKRDNLFIAFGGIPETCIVNNNKESGWAVLGLGILLKEHGSEIMNKKEWQQALKDIKNINKKINGHYILVKWRKNNINFISDPLGLRNLYYFSEKEEKVFSTRLDWIAKFRKKCSIDFETFGSSWLTYNNLSYNPIIKSIKRIGPGGKISITKGKLKATREEWLPSFRNYDFLELEERLIKISIPEPFRNKTLSFGLSGGFDSRMFLSILFPASASNLTRKIMTHTFGEKDDPDVEVARRITKDLQIPHKYLNEKTIYDDTYFSNLHSFVSQSNMIGPASSYQIMRYFSHKYFKDKILIDGAFGGIARRVQHNRLLKFGYKGLKEGNPELIYKHIEFPRGTIFRDKYMKEMKRGTIGQIVNLIERLPSVKKIGCENFVDLLTIKTRPPNYSGAEQARLDNMMVNYIPFLQIDILDTIFGMDLYWRENGRYFRRIVKKFRPELIRYPITKGNNKFPYILPTSVATAYIKLKDNIFPSYRNDHRIKFYYQLKKHILGFLDSNDFKNFSPYHHKRIKNIINDFYAGLHSNVNNVDWWYTFEIWRRELGIE
jgi:hypothetical protein